MDSIAASAIASISDFGTQQLSNTSWSFAVLELLHHPLLDSIAAKAKKTIAGLAPSNLSRAQIIDFVFDFTGLAWAFEFVFRLDHGLLKAIRTAELACGRELDGRLASEASSTFASTSGLRSTG